MPKLSEAIPTNEITLPVSGAKVWLKDALGFDDDLTLRRMPDPAERGLEALKRVLVTWDFYLPDGETQAPPDANTLGQLARSDTDFLLTYIAETVNRPRTEAERRQQEADAAAVAELMQTAAEPSEGFDLPSPNRKKELQVLEEDEIDLG